MFLTYVLEQVVIAMKATTTSRACETGFGVAMSDLVAGKTALE